MDKRMKHHYLMIGFLTYHGIPKQHHTVKVGHAIAKIARLAKKHRVACEWLCNGRKWNCQHGPEYTQDMFDVDINKIKNNIYKALKLAGMVECDWVVYFQNDPRGATVRLYYRMDGGVLRDLTELFYI